MSKTLYSACSFIICISASLLLNAFTDTNTVVGVVVGYENVMQLQTGELVRTFPSSLSSNAAANCRAVLLSVLSPHKWQGKAFLLQRCGCQCRHCRIAPLPRIYEFGRKYSFSGSEIVERMLFDIGLPSDMNFLSIPKNSGEEVLPTKPMDNNSCMIESVDMDGIELGFGITPQESWKYQLDAVWNPDIVSLKRSYMPSLMCTNMTLAEILDKVDNAFSSVNTDPRHRIKYRVEIIRGPSDAKWVRRYDLKIKDISTLKALLEIGKLDGVSLYVNLSMRSSATFVYKVPLDSQFVDWSGSVYSKVIPRMSFYDISLRELTQNLFNNTLKKWYDAGEISEATFGFGIKDKEILSIRRSLSFDELTLRDAILEISKNYGVRYDFRCHLWEEVSQ